MDTKRKERLNGQQLITASKLRTTDGQLSVLSAKNTDTNSSSAVGAMKLHLAICGVQTLESRQPANIAEPIRKMVAPSSTATS